MLRSLFFFVKLALLVAVAVWVAERPGAVSLEWLGYRLDTSVGVLLLGTFLIGIAAAVTYRFWGFVLRAPGSLGRAIDQGRRRRGYKALTQGMVAVAAGDPEEARRWARKADGLLDEAPLTRLLAAQSAQLGGDEQAAKRYFEAMLEHPETRFLGLRGLLMQALRDGEQKAALGYAEQAYRLRPHTPWVLDTLFDLSERAGRLDVAEKAITEAARHKALPAPEAARKRALVMLEQALAARGSGQGDQALKLARAALKLAPDLVPASLLAAAEMTVTGRGRDAARLLEKAWAAQPHPELAPAYRAARPAGDAIEGLKTLTKLVASRPDHPESRLVLAEAAFEAKLWGEARRYLGEATELAEAAAPGERVCRLMARLEEAEHDDSAKAREWLLRAGAAAADPAWVCRDCGAMAEQWSARCGACNRFDGLEWRAPRRVVAAVAAAAEEGTAVAQIAAPRSPAPGSAPPAEGAGEAGEKRVIAAAD